MSGLVYFALAQNGLIKIGKTNNYVRRMRSLRTMSASPHIFSVGIESYDSTEFERRLHKIFIKHRSHGEWFMFSKDMAKQLYISLLACGEPEHYHNRALERMIQKDQDAFYFNYDMIWIMLPPETALKALLSLSQQKVYKDITLMLDEVIRKAIEVTHKYKGSKRNKNNDCSILDIFRYSLRELNGSLSYRALYKKYKDYISQLELRSMLEEYDNQIFTLDGKEIKVVPSNGGNEPRRLVPLSELRKNIQTVMDITNTN